MLLKFVKKIDITIRYLNFSERNHQKFLASNQIKKNLTKTPRLILFLALIKTLKIHLKKSLKFSRIKYFVTKKALESKKKFYWLLFSLLTTLNVFIVVDLTELTKTVICFDSDTAFYMKKLESLRMTSYERWSKGKDMKWVYLVDSFSHWKTKEYGIYGGWELS